MAATMTQRKKELELARLELDYQTLEKLNKDLREAAKKIGRDEARYLVKMYYTIQDFRIQASNQISANKRMGGDPMRLQEYIFGQLISLEKEIQKSLKYFVSEYTVGQWFLREVCGIGPTIAAGLMSEIDIRLCKTAGHLWSFAGIYPGVKWEKGQKRPWSRDFKTLCCHPETLITTKRGIIPIPEVQVGDEVLTHRGRWRKVTTTIQNHHVGPLVTLEDNHRISLLVTPEHPIYSPRSLKGRQWVPAEYLVVGDVGYVPSLLSEEGGRWTQFTRIETYPYEGPVYNLEVEEDESYVANGIAVHNCTFRAGESFIKHQNSKNDFYGKIYAARKEEETAKNEKFEYADQAKEKLEKFNIGKNTEAYAAYSQGKLPKGHIHARARRYAVKIFLSHVHHVFFEDYYGEQPPYPYVFVHSDKDHRHYLAPPHWPMTKEWKSLRDMYPPEQVADKTAHVVTSDSKKGEDNGK